MRIALIIPLVLLALACRPVVRSGITIDYDRQGEWQTVSVNPKWEHVTLRHWTEDNRGQIRSKVVGEADR